MKRMCVVLVAAFFATTAWASVETAKEAFDHGKFDQAIAELQPLAEAGDVQAQYWLGRSYDAVGRPEAALSWLEKAAASGNDDAQRILGIYYDEGKGVATDRLAAACWYRQSAISGNSKAQRYLALMFADGRGVARDDERAAYWLERAVAAGNSDAKRNLAQLYYFGIGVEKDRAKAAQLFASAAKELSAAKADLGKMYYWGTGVPKDLPRAMALFSDAAAAGDVSGQYYLGRMYARGEATDRNYAKAYFWLALAAKAVAGQEDPDPDGWRAHEWVDKLAGKLGQDQVRAVQKRVDAWQPQ